MSAAWLLTLLALAGVIAGILIGEARTLSSHLGAAGGGLLFGIALFWLMPDIAEISGWARACALAVFACGAMLLGVIAGGVLFLGVHALWPGWKRPSVTIVFLATLALVGIIRA